MCGGPDVCTHAIVIPLGCATREDERARIRVAAEQWNATYPSFPVGVDSMLMDVSTTALLKVRILRSRAVPCGNSEWMLAKDPPFHEAATDTTRELLDDEKRVGCSSFPEGREFEVFIREAVCDASVGEPSSLGSLLDLKYFQTRAEVARYVVRGNAAPLPSRAFTSIGPDDAPVVITAFTELVCETSSMVQGPVGDLLRTYPDTLQVVHRSYVDRGSKVVTVELMVRAALAAARQGKEQAFIDSVPGFPAYQFLDAKWVLAKADGLGLDLVRFEADLAKPPGAFINEEASAARWAEHTAAYRAFPGTSHLDSIAAARALIAAARQGHIVEMRRWLVAHCDTVANADFAAVAKDLGMDVPRFVVDFSSEETLATIAEDLALATRLGTEGLLFNPGLFAEGKRLPHEWPIELYPDLLPALAERREAQ